MFRSSMSREWGSERRLQGSGRETTKESFQADIGGVDVLGNVVGALMQ